MQYVECNRYPIEVYHTNEWINELVTVLSRKLHLVGKQNRLELKLIQVSTRNWVPSQIILCWTATGPSRPFHSKSCRDWSVIIYMADQFATMMILYSWMMKREVGQQNWHGTSHAIDLVLIYLSWKATSISCLLHVISLTSHSNELSQIHCGLGESCADWTVCPAFLQVMAPLLRIALCLFHWVCTLIAFLGPVSQKVACMPFFNPKHSFFSQSSYTCNLVHEIFLLFLHFRWWPFSDLVPNSGEILTVTAQSLFRLRFMQNTDLHGLDHLGRLVHGHAHRFRHQYTEICIDVGGWFTPLLSPYFSTVYTLARVPALRVMGPAQHFWMCLWVGDSRFQHLPHHQLKLWSLMFLVFTCAHLYIKSRGSHRKLLPVFPGNVTTSSAPHSAQPRRARCGHQHHWWGHW